MKIIKTIYVIISLCICLLLSSCSKKDDASISTSSIIGTKWTLSGWDYSLGEDYIGLHNEVYQFFFHSANEGTFYYGRKDDYSDQGASTKRVACHFKYTVKGKEVKLDYFTDEVLSNKYFTIKGNKLISGKWEFTKDGISYEDNKWLNSIHGTTGDCSWYTDICGTLYIKGSGAMSNYSSYETTPWSKNKHLINKIIVGEGVTTIGSYAFANTSIYEVEMPDASITQICDYAFQTSLINSIWISHSTTHIGTGAFSGCKNLKDINIPKNLQEVGMSAFSGCTKLNTSTLEFGDNLKIINDFAFEGGKAGSLIFKEGVQTIGIGAFLGNYCTINKDLVLPNSLTSIGANAFEGTFNKIVIGKGVNQIGNNAFLSSVSSGMLYINLATPPSTGDNIIAERTNWNGVESRWTLYVPKGCKSTYEKKAPWNRFKSIIEDSNLGTGNNGGSNDDDNNDDDNNDDDGNENVVKVDYENLAYIANGETYKMILVDGGTLSPFYIMQTEVPVDGYLQIGDNYIGVIDKNGDSVIIKAELRAFINKLREVTGLEFRLPTIAEWQFAAQGGAESNGYTYSGSNNINDVAWYKSNSSAPHDLATKAPNELGLYDMSGNYGEVCSDGHYDIDGYICGGCWNDIASNCTTKSKKNGDSSASKIPGTKLKELNAVNGKYITVRLAYSIPQ